jgi:hypothetical protein
MSEVSVLDASNATPATPGQPVTRQSWWLVRRPRARWVAASVLVLVGGVLLVHNMLPSGESAAIALVHLGRERPGALGRLPSETAAEEDYSTFCRKQAALAKNRVVLARALSYEQGPGGKRVSDLPLLKELDDIQQDNPQLMWMEQHVRAEVKPEDGTLRISFVGGDPQDQLFIVKAITDAYLQQSNQNQMALRATQLQKLQEIAMHCKRRLTLERSALENLRALDDGKPIRRPELIPEDLKTYQRELTRVRIARIALQAKASDNDGPVLKEDASAYQALEKEERLLQAQMDVETIVFRKLELTQTDLDGQRQAIEMLEDLVKRTNAQILVMSLNAEFAAEPRVRLLVEPYIATKPVPWYDRWLRLLK